MRLLLLLLLLVAPAWGFESREYEFSVRSPEGWEERAAQGAVVQFLAPKTPLARSTLEVAVSELGEVDQLTREDALGIVRHLAGSIEGFQMQGSKNVEVGGRSAQRITYKGRVGKHILSTTQVFLARGGRLYLFTLTTAPDQHAEHAKVLDGVLGSLRWLTN